jgi:hypothetical protein
MKVLLKRIYNCSTYCIGHIYVDGYGKSVGFIDLTEFQGATIELKSHPWNVPNDENSDDTTFAGYLKIV